MNTAAVIGPDFPGENLCVTKERDLHECGANRTCPLVLEAWDRLGLEPRNRDGRYEAANAVPLTASNGKPNGSNGKHGKGRSGRLN